MTWAPRPLRKIRNGVICAGEKKPCGEKDGRDKCPRLMTSRTTGKVARMGRNYRATDKGNDTKTRPPGNTAGPTGWFLVTNIQEWFTTRQRTWNKLNATKYYCAQPCCEDYLQRKEEITVLWANPTSQHHHNRIEQTTKIHRERGTITVRSDSGTYNTNVQYYMCKPLLAQDPISRSEIIDEMNVKEAQKRSTQIISLAALICSFHTTKI